MNDSQIIKSNQREYQIATNIKFAALLRIVFSSINQKFSKSYGLFQQKLLPVAIQKFYSHVNYTISICNVFKKLQSIKKFNGLVQ